MSDFPNPVEIGFAMGVGFCLLCLVGGLVLVYLFPEESRAERDAMWGDRPSMDANGRPLEDPDA